MNKTGIPVNSNTFYVSFKDCLNKTKSTPSKDTLFEVLNPLKPNLEKRSDSDVSSMRNLLFEFDNISLQEQEELIEKNKKYINRVVFSGNKSYHVRITLTEEPESILEYKYIWTQINDDLFQGLADTQCKNPSRLTRCPDAVRLDTGKIQSLYFYSENTFLDATEYHSEFIEWQKRQKNKSSFSLNSKTKCKVPFDCLLSIDAKNILSDIFPRHHRVETLGKGIPVLLKASYTIEEIRLHILTIAEPERRYASLNYLKWFEAKGYN